MKRSITTPAPALQPLQHALATARNKCSRRQAAMAILNAYFGYYQLQGVRQHMEQLYKAATNKAGKRSPITKEVQRLFFYEFSVLVLEAASVIREVKREKR